MDRKETTAFLGNLLISTRLSGIGKYYASEVSLDYGTKDVRRVDFMQFVPQNQISVGGLEKGIFVCYEIKSCREDYYSGYGQNFVGEKNYYVMPMQTYKELLQDLNKEFNVGVMVPIPYGKDVYEEFETPTPLDAESRWVLKTVKPCHPQDRKKSLTELLFCMLRAGR